MDEVAPLLQAASALAIPADDDDGREFGRGKRPRPPPSALRDVHDLGMSPDADVLLCRHALIL